MCLGWQDLGDKYRCESVGFEYRSVCIWLSQMSIVISRKETEGAGGEAVNFMVGWQVLRKSITLEESNGA